MVKPTTKEVVETIVTSLPPRGPKSSSLLSSSLDLIALSVHGIAVAYGMKFIRMVGDESHTLSATWNHSVRTHSFTYMLPRSELRVDRMGPRIEVRGSRDDGDETYRVEVKPSDWVLNKNLPIRSALTEEIFKTLWIEGGFERFVQTIVENIVAKLMDGGDSEFALIGKGEADDDGEGHGVLDFEEAEESEKAKGTDPVLPTVNDVAESSSKDKRLSPRRSRLTITPLTQPTPTWDSSVPIPSSEMQPPPFTDEHQMTPSVPELSRPVPTGILPHNLTHDDINPPPLMNPMRQTSSGLSLFPNQDLFMTPGYLGDSIPVGFNPSGGGGFPGVRYDPTTPLAQPGVPPRTSRRGARGQRGIPGDPFSQGGQIGGPGYPFGEF